MREILALMSSYDAQSLLHELEKNLTQTRLKKEKLALFFASLWAFYKETPNGILSLSLRLSDEWMTLNEWEATAQAAYILSANCDEFGLSDVHQGFQKTHHQLLLLSAAHFGIDKIQLKQADKILPQAIEMGAVSYDYYRMQSVGAGLGFHLASEYTSNLEFSAFLNGFLAHKKVYQLTDTKNPVVRFFKVHTIVEPYHQQLGETIIMRYLSQYPDAKNEVLKGIEGYFRAYMPFFKKLNQELFYVKKDTFNCRAIDCRA